VFGLGPATRIYLAAGVTDMRKGFEGLYGLVEDRLSCEPLSGHLFLISAKARPTRGTCDIWAELQIRRTCSTLAGLIRALCMVLLSPGERLFKWQTT
jgi:hypothetical protein